MAKLKCETNTPEIEKEILDAAAFELDLHHGRLYADFEHGQWWVTDLPSGAQWSVHDAEGYGTSAGFCFEQVSEGEED